MAERIEFPLQDPEQARTLLTEVYQAIRTALDLNTQLAAHVDQASDEEARRLNDAVFIVLSDAKQRLEVVVGRPGDG